MTQGNSTGIDSGNLSWRTFLRFLVVGGSATLLHYFLTASFVWLELLPPITASGIGFLISAIANYVASAKFTFSGKHRHSASFPKFCVTAGIGVLINTGLLALLGSYEISFYISQLVATAIVVLWNYSINAIWTFRTTVN